MYVLLKLGRFFLRIIFLWREPFPAKKKEAKRFEVTLLLLCKIILDNKSSSNHKFRRLIILPPIYQKGVPTRLAVLLDTSSHPFFYISNPQHNDSHTVPGVHNLLIAKKKGTCVWTIYITGPIQSQRFHTLSKGNSSVTLIHRYLILLLGQTNQPV